MPPPQIQLTVSVPAGDGSDDYIPYALVPGPASPDRPVGVRELRPAIPPEDGETLRVELRIPAAGYVTVLSINSLGELRFLGLYLGTFPVAAGKRTLTEVTAGPPDRTDDLLVVWTPQPLNRNLTEWQRRLSSPQEPLGGDAVLLRLSTAEAPLLRVQTRGTKYPPPPPTTVSHGYVGEPHATTKLPEAIGRRRPFSPITPASDPVDCTVFAPPRARPGETLLIQVFAHIPATAYTALAMAREFDESAERRGFKSLETEVLRGTRLTFHLALTMLTVTDPVQSLTWRGRTESVQFSATVPSSTAPGKQVGTVTICQDGTPIGHIKFALQIEAAAGKPAEPEPLGAHAHRYREVFISYASRDRTEVLKRVQMLDRFRLSYFQDVLSLEPGARWERELYKHIDRCDLFLLFWSSAARDSEWVLKEVRYAMTRKGGDDANPPEIMPVILEGPPPVKPPEDLSQFHFNDKLRYFMDVPTA